MADQETRSKVGTPLSETTVAEFSARLRGRLISPGDVDYDEARSIQNGLIDRRPALLVRCSGAADVIEAVNFARQHDLLVSVLGGGHGVAGSAINDGGIVIDLSSMRGVHVDAKARTVRAQGGATWGDVDRETQVFGLATPGGVVSTTGIAGLTLHGGFGHLRRKYGLSVDNLVSVDIVTADGQLCTASATENEDLFWAVRGAGSNFGVVTSFEFRLHPVGPEVMLCAPVYALEDAPGVLSKWRDFMATAPEEITSLAVFWSVPSNPPAFPQELHGRPILVIGAVYAGPAETGAAVMQPLRELATPVIDLSGPEPFTAVQASFDPFFPKGQLRYWKSLYVDGLTEDLINELHRLASERPSTQSDLVVWHNGGAMSRVGAEETAFGSRSAPFLINVEATWTDPADTDRNVAWARAGWDTLHRYSSSGGLYLNFPGFGEEKDDLVRAAYGANYQRLVALKNKYDPTNMFRSNQNIKPTV